jgi:hypothetical protein
MNGRSIGASYAHSFLWIVFFFAAAVSLENVAHLVFFDIVHGNPHRTRGDVISMIETTPILGIVTSIGAMLVFTLPQIFQAVLITVWHRKFDYRALFSVLPAVPLTAVLTWYCYDYLTPSVLNLAINVSPDWTPYQHGISLKRYLDSLLFQTPVTLFSFLYFNANVRGASKWPILIATLVIVIATGCVWGYFTAQKQIAFLSLRR